MKLEDKKLLLKDLCARLPYLTLCYCKWTKDAPNGTSGCIQEVSTYLLDELMIIDDRNYECQICEIKPYLRPMSSMTDGEKEELTEEHKKDEIIYIEIIERVANGDEHARGTAIPHFAADWCNERHFDYRGLIEKGLAIAVTTENNPYKE